MPFCALTGATAGAAAGAAVEGAAGESAQARLMPVNNSNMLMIHILRQAQ